MNNFYTTSFFKNIINKTLNDELKWKHVPKGYRSRTSNVTRSIKDAYYIQPKEDRRLVIGNFKQDSINNEGEPIERTYLYMSFTDLQYNCLHEVVEYDLDNNYANLLFQLIKTIEIKINSIDEIINMFSDDFDF
ncbi:MAG: hypothetical protein K0R80_2147 [Clostridia bacterium]|jgi:hypothetical protein|nr:hypothetical protein [Clostridia bacterium]